MSRKYIPNSLKKYSSKFLQYSGKAIAYPFKVYFKLMGYPFEFLSEKIKDPRKLALISGITYGFILSAFDYYWTYRIYPTLDDYLNPVIYDIQKTYHLTIYNLVWLGPLPSIFKKYKVLRTLGGKVTKYLKKVFGALTLSIFTLAWLVDDTIGWFFFKWMNEGWDSAVSSMKFLYFDGYLGLQLGTEVIVPSFILFLMSAIRFFASLASIYSLPPTPISTIITAEYQAQAEKARRGLEGRL